MRVLEKLWTEFTKLLGVSIFTLSNQTKLSANKASLSWNRTGFSPKIIVEGGMCKEYTVSREESKQWGRAKATKLFCHCANKITGDRCCILRESPFLSAAILLT